MAEGVLAGKPLTSAEALEILQADDNEILHLLSAAFLVRAHYFGRQVQLYFLMNAKSGLCPEDCGYCSQSKVSDADIPTYNLLTREKLLAGARAAAERQAKTYCLVISARGPSETEIRTLEQIVPEIKQLYQLDICTSLGLLTSKHAERLKACGVNRINHNLNTSDQYYAEICSTHNYQDRLDTLKASRDAGLQLCSGGIIGMGESPQDVVDMALALRDLGVESIPVNFYNPIEGTPLAVRTGVVGTGAVGTGAVVDGTGAKGAVANGTGAKNIDTNGLTPNYCLKVLAMVRLTNPNQEVRMAAGRELHLRSLQALGLYAANSLFVGDYLTTKGQLPEEDYQMICDLGFEIVGDGGRVNGN
jgi:biotin synthase